MANAFVNAQARGFDQRTPEAGLVKNKAGGYVFDVGTWGALDRFLILGSTSPTYYASKQTVIKDGLDIFARAYAEDPSRVLARVIELDADNRVMRRATLIFALGFLFANAKGDFKYSVRQGALKVLRTASDMFNFVQSYRDLGGKLGGSSVRNFISDWYNSKSPERLAYQVTKYRNRAGWTHRDMLRIGHVKPDSALHNSIFEYAVTGGIREVTEDFGRIAKIAQFEQLQAAGSEQEVVTLLRDSGLTWEQVPQRYIKSRAVWEQLATQMPLMALTRNIGRMLSYGVSYRTIVNRLRDKEAILKSRIHPMAFLQAWGVQRMGRGVRGSLSWTPNASVGAALQEAFETAFGNLEKHEGHVMIGLDVSGSMGTQSDLHGLSVREVSAALAIILNQQFEGVDIYGFTAVAGGGWSGVWRGGWMGGTEFEALPIGSLDLESYIQKISGLPFGGTDCALPMIKALEMRRKYKGFVVLTDNETWAGDIKPHAALAQYEREICKSKLVVCGMTQTSFSIADPNASNMLDVVGCDSALPKLVADFIAG